MANEPDTKTLTKLDLSRALSETRTERGLTIEEVAKVISEHFDDSELQSLINSINNEHLQS